MKINKQKILPFTILMVLNSNYLLADELHITLPNVPVAPKVNAKVVSPLKVIVHNSNNTSEVIQSDTVKNKKGILFDKRIPPATLIDTKVKDIKVKNTNDDNSVGKVLNNKVSVYLQSNLISVDDVISKLEDADFDILAKYEIDKNKEYISIVFTNKSIIEASSKKSRGFASTLRLLINKKDNTVSINNPIYVMKAFMQADYNEKLALDTLESIIDVFDDAKESKERMKFSHLEKYQFMIGMPHYEDMLEIASNTNDSLIASARKSDQIVYEQKLDNGSISIGVKLSSKTSEFVKKIGFDNSELLPYPVLIENNKAKILAPKFYIALMYPTLSMSQFMSISTAPGEIEKDCDKVFR